MNTLLLEHFDQLISTPEDVERLNLSILQLAMQGKLGSQDSEDEPAIKALQRICKQEEIVLPSISDDSKAFELPDSWEWTTLGFVSKNIHYGYTASADFSSKEHRLLRITDIQDSRVEWEEVPGCVIADAEAEKYLLQNGDILIARTGGTIGKSYLVANIKLKAVFASYLIRVLLSKEVLPEYIKLFLDSPLYWRQLTEKSKGTGQPNVNATSLSQLVFGLPPFAEQGRIVARVEELFAQTRLLAEQLSHSRTELDHLNESALAHLLASETADEFNERWAFIAEHFDLLTSAPEHVAPLRQSVLDLAVRGKLTRREAGDEPAKELLKRIKAEKDGKEKPPMAISDDEKPFELPAGWEWSRISSIADIGTGSTPLTTRLEYYENGNLPWVTSSATNKPFINKAEKYITEIAQQEMRLRLYPVNTLIVALYGQGKTRGQVSELMIPATINQACAALVFKGETSGLRQYVKLFFMKNYNELRALAEGGAQPNLNVGKVSNMVLPIPPLAEQERIVKRVEQLLGWCDALEAQLRSAEEERGRLVESVLARVI